MPPAQPPAIPKLRLDKWLWQARFFRSRTLAAELVHAGHLRLNGQRVVKPGATVGPGDTLTFPQGDRIRLIRVQATGLRRGPATEAQALYLDLDAPPLE
ncbi:MAG: RNA-binding S4 domain-containing protein [Gemmobacter sp.]